MWLISAGMWASNYRTPELDKQASMLVTKGKEEASYITLFLSQIDTPSSQLLL